MDTIFLSNIRYQKCGEITIAIEVGKKIFALKCIYCTAQCTHLEDFVLHIEEQHSKEIYESLSILEEYYESSIEVENKAVTSLFVKDEEEEELLNVHNETLNNRIQISECQLDNAELCNIKDPLDPNFHASVSNAKTIDKDNETDILTADKNFIDEFKISDAHNEFSDNEATSDRDGELNDTDTQSEFSDKNLVLTIINIYKQHTVLWKSDDSMSKNRKIREEALKSLTNEVNNQLETNLKKENILEHIMRMRCKYRKELQMIKVAESKGESYTPQWFFDKLDFLNNTIKYKQRNKRITKTTTTADKVSLPLTTLTEAQNIELIGIYKSFPSLWNVQHIGFRFKNQRQNALMEMLETVNNKMNLKLTLNDLQKKLYRIRYTCTQEKHRKMTCANSIEEFKPLCKYYEHIAFLEDNVGPFKCSYCAKFFNGSDQYKIHLSQHDGSMPFRCPLCSRGFMKVGNCIVHLRRHTRDYPFECKVCGKRYATSTDITVHMRNHTGEKPYICEVCGQLFRTWTFFDAHMRRHKKKRSHKCTICSKAFYENNKLTEHMKIHFNVRDEVCNVCGKAFTSSKYLRQHKQIHAEKKKYTCKLCGKNFAQYAGLSGHMKTHGPSINGAAYEEN